jgi:hypothetical protein
VILAVTGFAYLLGLSNYGVAEEGTADDTDTGHQVRRVARPGDKWVTNDHEGQIRCSNLAFSPAETGGRHWD